MNPMDKFFTREKAEAGITLPLYLPSGEKSGEWVKILGVDSFAFRLKESELKRSLLTLAKIEDESERYKALEKLQWELIATLVVGWSFDIPCTRENIVNFFHDAPQIANAIDSASSNRLLFSMGAELNSLSGVDTVSG